MLKSGESRAESQPSKKTHVLQKQDSSKYLRGENTHTATSNQSKTAAQPENPEVRIPKKHIREKSANSSVTRGAIKNSAVIYKVSFFTSSVPFGTDPSQPEFPAFGGSYLVIWTTGINGDSSKFLITNALTKAPLIRYI